MVMEFLTAMAVATPGLLGAWAFWMLIQRSRYFQMKRELRERKKRVHEKHVEQMISRQAKIVRMGVHQSRENQEKKFMEAFYQAWIEPTLEIIALIDAECTPPEPEPEHICPPCDHGSETKSEFAFQMAQRMKLQQDHIRALETRLKEVLDRSIQQNMMYASRPDTKRIFR